MKPYAIYLLALLQLGPPPLSAQFAQPAFRHYSTADGLPSPEVYEVLQDSRGYLWFGTDHGVSRFNGYSFENFGVERGLRDNVVFYLREDPRGRIWMVSMSERLYYYDYERDSVIAYEHNPILLEHATRQAGPQGFHVDSAGTIFRSLENRGVLKIGPEERATLLPEMSWEGTLVAKIAGQYFLTQGANYQEEWLKKGRASFLYHDESGWQWIELTFRKYPASNSKAYVVALADDRWLLQAYDYFYLFNGCTLVWSRPAPGFQLISTCRDARGRIFLGGLGGGVRMYEDEEALKNDRYSAFLEGYSVSHIVEDRQGGYWFTTTEDGVFHAPVFAFNVFNRSHGLPEDHIVSLHVGRPDSIWVATRRGALLLIDGAGRKVIPLPRPWGPVELFDLQRGPAGRLWLATGAGLYRSAHDGTIQKVSLPVTRFSYFKKLFFSRKNPDHLYLLWSYGFLKISIRQQSVLLDAFDLGFSHRINDLLEDRRGRLWIGTTEGLFVLQGDSLVSPVRQHPHLGLRVEALAETDEGALVIGTKGAGLLLWRDDAFREVGVKEGLASAMVESLHVDEGGNVWVATFEGISRLSPDGRIVNYSVRDGLPSNEVTAIHSHGGRVWAAGRGGLVEIADKKSGATPPPFVEELRINNKMVRPDRLRRLAPGQNHLQLSLLSIDYAQYGRISYRYRLGPQEAWNYGTNRRVNYAALAPGAYRFEAQAQDKDGGWSTSYVLPFVIRPPFWRRWWFWALLSLSVGGIVYLFYRDRLVLYRQQMALQQAQLQYERERAATQKQIQDLQAVALRAQMNPHFIFNCLNAIQGFIAGGEKLDASRYLARFARLMRGTLDASLDVRISLREEVTMLENYLALEQMRFDRHFSYQVELADGLDAFDTTIPPLLVQPFVENAIVHGLTDTSREGRVEVRYQKVEDRLRVTVTDNGIGPTAARGRQTAAHRSVGMTLTQKRLALLDRSRRDEAIQILETKDETGVVTGTRVIIDIPVGGGW